MAQTPSIYWFNTSSNKVTYAGGVLGLKASTSAATGSFLQLIWAGPDKTNNLARTGLSCNGSSGDDEVHDVGFCGRGTTAGPPNPTTDGLMQVFKTCFVTSHASGDVFFVRAWSAPAARYDEAAPAQSYVPVAPTNFYGDSALYVFQDRPIGDDFNFGSQGGRVGWQAALHPNADSHSNGIPDWWAWQYFGTLDVSPTNDPDEDDYNNGDEYVALTDPTNALSHFPYLLVSAVTNLSGELALQLEINPTSPQRVYDLFWATNLMNQPQAWPAQGMSVTGLANGLKLTVTNRSGPFFYRSGVRLPDGE